MTQILEARIQEWVEVPSPGDLPDPRIETVSPVLQVDFFLPADLPGKPLKQKQINVMIVCHITCWYIF